MYPNRIVIAAAITGFLCATSLSAASAQVLTSAPAKASPAIDGQIEDAWSTAKVLDVRVDKRPYEPDNGYPGLTSTTVSMRAMHDAQYLYLLVEYADPSHSLERYPWVKQPDGSWKQKKNKDSTGHENTYYEDKFAILWDINARGFRKKGCDAACHLAQDGKVNGITDKAPGRKYTTRDGQTIDMWHWKSVRSNPVGQVDDQYIDNTADPAQNANWGRKGDTKTGGGYSNNVTKGESTPPWMPADRATGGYWLLKSDKVAFEDGFQSGDVLPGILVSRFEGPRGDIEAMGVWHDGKWIIEMKRRLVTTGDNATVQDVQFADPAKRYPFGVAVFDNSQIDHVYHENVLELEFTGK